MVDSFHITKSCMPVDNANCQYHLTLPKFLEIHGMNTECAEQSSLAEQIEVFHEEHTSVHLIFSCM